MNTNVPQAAILFFMLEKLGVIKITFHRVDMINVFELPTERVVPGASSEFGSFGYTWEPNPW